MLVLTRKVGERIVIGDSVELTVLEVKGRRVRLGVVAPREVPVHRAEVAEEIDLSIIHGLCTELATIN